MPRPQRRAARNRSRPVAEPRGLWEDNPPNEPNPGATAEGQEGDEPDPGTGCQWTGISLPGSASGRRAPDNRWGRA